MSSLQKGARLEKLQAAQVTMSVGKINSLQVLTYNVIDTS